MARTFNRVVITGLAGGTMRTNRRSVRFDLGLESDVLPVFARRVDSGEAAPPRGSLVLVDASFHPRPTPFLSAYRVIVITAATAASVKRSPPVPRTAPGHHWVLDHKRHLRDGRVVNVTAHGRGHGPLRGRSRRA